MSTEDTCSTAPQQEHNDNNSEQEQQQVEEEPKFEVRDRVYARDVEESGLLYKAIVRKKMYGAAPPKQVRVGVDPSLTSTNIQHRLDNLQEEPPMWHYFVHYLGWNVKWDRWVPQECLYAMTDEISDMAKLLEKEMGLLKKTHSKQDLMLHFRKRIKELEESQQQENSGKDSNEEVAAELEEEASREKKYNTAFLNREKKLREMLLSSASTKNTSSRYNLVLSLSLKKVLVEDWEIVTQCGMVHKLPATISIRQALQQYLDVKLKNCKSWKTNHQNHSNQQDASGLLPCTESQSSSNESIETTNASSSGSSLQQAPQQDSEKLEEEQLKIKQWTDMVDGICLLFDQALAFRLLYPQEVQQEANYDYSGSTDKTEAEAINDEAVGDETAATKRQPQEVTSVTQVPLTPCQVYGCEFLLRLLVQLPLLLEDQLLYTQKEQTRPMMSKLHDLIRHLQKHQSTLFTQRYEKRIAEKKRKASSNRKSGRNVRAKKAEDQRDENKDSSNNNKMDQDAENTIMASNEASKSKNSGEDGTDEKDKQNVAVTQLPQVA